MNRRDTCAPPGWWALTDQRGRQDPGVQDVHDDPRVTSPSAMVEPMTHTRPRCCRRSVLDHRPASRLMRGRIGARNGFRTHEVQPEMTGGRLGKGFPKGVGSAASCRKPAVRAMLDPTAPEAGDHPSLWVGLTVRNVAVVTMSLSSCTSAGLADAG